MSDTNSRYEDIIEALAPLFKEAWAEVGDAPFNPRWEVGERLYELGLSFFAYDSLTKPTCYAWCFVDRSVFTGEINLQVLSIYVRPKYRSTKKLLQLYREVRKEAKARGCKFMYFRIPYNVPYAESFVRHAERFDYEVKMRV